MYLKRFTIERIKCFDRVELHFPHTGGDFSGWVVLLGGNGTGKSTLLQAMALALVGPLAGQRLLRPEGWLRAGARHAAVLAEIVKGDQDSQKGQPRKKPYEVGLAVTGNEIVELEGQDYDQPQLVQLGGASMRKALSSGPYAASRIGWFSCGYGPFRRLSGGDSAEAKLVSSQGREARFATLFRESAALTHCQDWLIQLYSRSIDPGNPRREQAERDLKVVRAFIDALLPGDVRIEKINTSNVYCRTIGGATVAVPELSDGYRSFLALVIDLLRHIHESQTELSSLVEETARGPCVTAEGVVLIDEVDAHLHPLWQRLLGFELRRVFPRMQFIVTSHSPFIAQAAMDDGLIVLKTEEGGKVGAVRPNKSVTGWRVEEVLTSPLFGLTGTRDVETEELIRQQSALVAKREWGQLSSEEQRKLGEIEGKLSERLTGPGETPEERRLMSGMKDYTERVLEQLGGDE